MLRESWVLILGLTFTAPARAQSPASPAAPPPAATTPWPPEPLPEALPSESSEETKAPTAAAPDLVVLKNGNRYRGTIAELVKGEFVAIVLATGETRRFAWDDVEHAGPAHEAPSAEPTATPQAALEPLKPLPPQNPDLHPVRFFSDRAGTHFFLLAGNQPVYRSTCTAPCTRELMSGTYRVAVHIQGDMMHADNPVSIDEPTRVTVNYRDRSGVRAAGAVVLVSTAILVGTLIAVVSGADSRVDKGPPIIFGIAIPGTVGIAVGLGLAFVDDKVVVRAAPLQN